MTFDAILLAVLRNLQLAVADIVLRPPLARVYCQEVDRLMGRRDIPPKLILQRLMELEPPQKNPHRIH